MLALVTEGPLSAARLQRIRPSPAPPCDGHSGTTLSVSRPRVHTSACALARARTPCLLYTSPSPRD
eukprot:10559419-Alexandrium_andersonii.AAC.1